jgi:hypothetical protein
MQRATVGTEPRLTEMGQRTMAVVHTRGDPERVAWPAIRALYATLEDVRVEAERRGGRVEIEALRARWLNAHAAPRENWVALWGLPVPDDTSSLRQVDPDCEVRLETWPYGLVAEVRHDGPFTTEPATVEGLQRFIGESGHHIAGPHEEEYLTPPGAPDQRTVIRYRVRPLEPPS